MILKQVSDNIVKKFEDSFKAAEVLKEINDATLTSTRGSDMIQKMADAVGDLSKEQAVLALTTKHVSKEDQFAILLKAGLVKETEREVFMTNADNVAKTGNLAITETLKNSYQGLAMAMGLTNVQLGMLLAGLLAIGVGVAVFNHFYDTADEIKEKADKAASSISNLKSEFESLKDTTGDIKHRFAELAQEVDNLGTLNQSMGTLNTEEYEEFLDLSNQLSELFPQLTKGYDDNGNAILNLSGNVNTIVGSLNDLVDVQRELANQEILDNMPDLWEGYVLDEAKYTNAKETAENYYNDLLSAFNSVRNKGSLSDSVADKALQEAFEDAGLNVSDYREIWSDSDGYNYGVWDFSALTDEQIKAVEFYYGKITQEYLKQTENAETKIKAANAEISKYLYTWFSIDSVYNKELDPEKNQIMEYLMSSFDISTIPTDVRDKGWEAVTDWIEDNILSSISSVDDEEVQQAMLSVLSGDYDSFPELKELYSIIQSYFSPDDPIMVYFDTNFGDLTDTYDNLVDNAAQKFSGSDGNSYGVNNAEDAKAYQKYQSERQALDEFARENSINTQNEIAFWDQCLEESETREEAQKRYLQKAEEFSEDLDSYLSKDDELRNYLLQLSETGSLDEDSLKDLSAYDDLLQLCGGDVEFLIEKLNELAKITSTPFDNVNNLSTMEDGFGALSSAYQERMIDGRDVSLDSLTSLYDQFGDIEGFDTFLKVMQDVNATAEECQKAFDDLATSYFKANYNLADLNDSNKQYTINMLESMGITNAQEVVEQSLTRANELRADALKEVQKAQADCTLTTEDLQNASLDELQALYAEATAAGVDADSLRELIISKLNLRKTQIDEANTIEELMEVAGAAALSAYQLSIYNAVKDGRIKDTGVLDGLLNASKEDLIKSTEEQFEAIMGSVGFGGGSGSGSGSGSPFDWSDLLDKEIKLLEKQLDAGLIDFDTYLNKRLDLINQYYNEGKIAADEYYAYLESTYDNQISIYDKVISAVTKKLNDQIEDLEKQKEVIEESYSLQIEKIENEISLLQEEADKKKDLMELEKARYNLERSLTQRTLKVK